MSGFLSGSSVLVGDGVCVWGQETRLEGRALYCRGGVRVYAIG